MGGYASNVEQLWNLHGGILVKISVILPMVEASKIVFSQKDLGFGVFRYKVKNTENLKGFHQELQKLFRFTTIFRRRIRI